MDMVYVFGESPSAENSMVDCFSIILFFEKRALATCSSK